MPLDDLHFFVVVLRVIHRNVWYMAKRKKGKERLKKNNQLLNLIFLSFFHFLHSDILDNKSHKQN